MLAPLSELARHMDRAGLQTGPCLLVTDENVAVRYLAPVRTALSAAGWMPYDLILPPGESTKSAGALGRIYDEALALGPSRAMPVLALGGGVVGDLAGFAAATLLRGLPLVQIPTSLIAQVDSAIGGKTGINHAAGKNLIGAFHPALLILTDPETLNTLPAREYQSGLAEVIKIALALDADFVDWLTQHWPNLIDRHPSTVAAMVERAAHLKLRVVAEDEREAGVRMLLNFGHTFGHALERVTGYTRYTHGEAVALGMHAALHLSASVDAGLALAPDILPDAWHEADDLVGWIPIHSPFPDADTDALIDAMQTDKKRSPDQLRYVVLDTVGSARVLASPPKGAVEAAWGYARDRSARHSSTQ